MSDAFIDLMYRPRPWQTEFHKKRKDRNILICHRRSGKTVAARMELVHCALEKPNTRYFYIAPFLKQVKGVVWDNLKTDISKIPGAIIRESELKVILPNGSTIQLYGADNAEALRGLGFHGGVLDEMADIEASFYGTVLIPTLMADRGWLIIIGTPKSQDQLSVMYDKYKNDPEWYTRILSCWDTGVFSAEELEKARREVTPRQFSQEMECKLDAGMDDTLISGDAVDAAMQRNIPYFDYREYPTVIGVDVARYGDDATAIVCRQGNYLHPLITMQGASTTDIARRVCEVYHEKQAEAVFLDYSGGLGAGVADQMLLLGVSPIEVHFGGKPVEEVFKNARAEMWHRMAQWIRLSGALPREHGLKVELCGPKYFYSKDDHKMQLESKADMKSRGLSSPDIADAIALTFYDINITKRSVYDRVQESTWTPFSILES